MSKVNEFVKNSSISQIVSFVEKRKAGGDTAGALQVLRAWEALPTTTNAMVVNMNNALIARGYTYEAGQIAITRQKRNNRALTQYRKTGVYSRKKSAVRTQSFMKAALLLALIAVVFYCTFSWQEKVPEGYQIGILEDLTTEVKDTFMGVIAPEDCNLLEVSTFIVCDKNGCLYPAGSTMTKGGVIKVEGFKYLKTQWEQNGIEPTVKALASRMVPLKFDDQNEFNWEAAFRESVEIAQYNDQSCMRIPNPDPWIGEIVNQAILAQDQTLPDTTYDVANPEVPLEDLVPKDPTPSPSLEPPRDPATEVVFKINSPFSEELGQIKLTCGQNTNDPIVSAACFNAAIPTFLAEGLEPSKQQIPAIASQICTNNLGVVTWDDLIAGDPDIWGYNRKFSVTGDPDGFALLSEDQTTCARIENGMISFAEGTWLTNPEDPYLPGYGSSFGYGVISLDAPSISEYSNVQAVYIWPVRRLK